MIWLESISVPAMSSCSPEAVQIKVPRTTVYSIPLTACVTSWGIFIHTEQGMSIRPATAWPMAIKNDVFVGDTPFYTLSNPPKPSMRYIPLALRPGVGER